MIPFVTNMLFTLQNEDDLILFKASVESIASVVDEIVLLETGRSDIHPVKEGLFFLKDLPCKVSYEYDSSIIEDRGFAEARNNLLDRSPKDCYILWNDSDECHFTDGLQQLKDLVLSTEQYDAISTHFIHFCIHSNLYERFEKRTNIFRKGTLRWIEKVHERIDPIPKKIFSSSYFYLHMGYVRDPEYVFSRWNQYALLEGQTTPYVNEEVDGKTVPYFRLGREGPKNILDDRLKTLIPYFGSYPASIPIKWIQSKL